MNSIKNKIILSISLLTLVISILLMVGLINDERTRQYRFLNQKIGRLSKIISNSVVEPLWDCNFEIVQKNCQAFFEDPELKEIFVKDNENKVVVDLKKSITRVSILEQTIPLVKEGHKIGFLHLVFTDYFIIKNIKQMTVKIAVFCLALMAIQVVVIFIISSFITGPLNKISRVFTDIVEGKRGINQKLKVKGSDEIAILSNAFNILMQNFQDVVCQANAVAGGVFSTQIIPKSENDELGLALHNMTNQLRIYAEKVNNKTTELSEANAALSEAKQIADKANQYKSIFLAQMTHDLRTPLHVVIGTLDMMIRNNIVKNNKQLFQSVNIALQSGERQLRLVNTILDLSKMEAGQMELNVEPFLFDELFDGLEVQMETLLKGRDVVFSIDNQIQKLVIKADKIRLQQIITNLLSNSAKFTIKGEIRLSVHLDDHICFSISDTGIGMSSEDIKRIFNLYTMIDNEFQKNVVGTGLGLSICKGFVEAHNGKIWAASEKGKGSNFEFWIPYVPGDLPDKKRAQGIEIDYDFLKTKKVLLVDDDEFNLMFAQMVFENKLNYKLVDNGKEAIQLVKEEFFDIVLTDYNMPETDGQEVLDEIRKFNQDILVAVLTATAMKGTREQMLRRGFSDFMTKPFKEEEILIFIQKKLRGSIN